MLRARRQIPTIQTTRMIMTGVSSPLCLVAGVAESPPVFDPEDTVNREIADSLVKVMHKLFKRG